MEVFPLHCHQALARRGSFDCWGCFYIISESLSYNIKCVLDIWHYINKTELNSSGCGRFKSKYKFKTVTQRVSILCRRSTQLDFYWVRWVLFLFFKFWGFSFCCMLLRQASGPCYLMSNLFFKSMVNKYKWIKSEKWFFATFAWLFSVYDDRQLHTCIGHVVRKGACIKQANVGGVSCLLKHVCCHKMRKFMLMYYF